MQINQTQSSQSFGHISFDERALTLLKKRLKGPADAEKLQRIVEASKKNPLETRVTAVDHFLSGEPDQFVGSTKYTMHGKTRDTYMWEWDQNFFECLINSPLRFIRNVSKKADKIAKQVEKADKLDAQL